MIMLTTPTGRDVTITFHRVDAGGYVEMTVVVPGTATNERACVRTVDPLPQATSQGATHAIYFSNRKKGGLGLDATEAARLETALIAYRDADPGYQAARLRSDRQDLVDAINAAFDAEAAAREVAFQRHSAPPAYGGDAVRAAEQALAAFDAAHPEIIAAIEQEHAARTADAMWR